MTFPDVVTLEQPTRTSAGVGAFTEGWGTPTSDRAHIQTASTGERQAAQQLKGRLTHIVYLRSGAAVTRGYRIKATNRTDVGTLIVLAKSPQSHGGFVRLLCEEVQAESAG